MRPEKTALALAGGGPLGAIYEIGTLVALDEALIGLPLIDCDYFVGVSSGSFMAAGLANGISPLAMHNMFIESDDAEEPFEPEILIKPAYRKYSRRLAMLPQLLLAAIGDYVAHPLERGLAESFERLSRAIPTGLFDNSTINAYLTQLFSMPGRTNDFRKLRNNLFLLAVDLDSGAAVPFGAPGHRDVPISLAVQASAALPGLFPPVEIDGHYYVDGVLKKTLNASAALSAGAKLVLCINPLVPFDADLALAHGHPTRHRLVEGGLPVVLSQTFRALIHSRMQVGMGKYKTQFRDADVVLFEPAADDAEMFFINVFSYASRRRLAEHAYQRTRADLCRRYDELAPLFARHGVRLDRAVLLDQARSLIHRTGKRKAPRTGATRELGQTLHRLELLLGAGRSEAQAGQRRAAPRRAR